MEKERAVRKEKGKSGLVKSDMWDKKGSKGVKGSKGSKGKGKKGKLNEVSESWNEDWTDWTAEGWDDDDYWWNDQWLESCDGQCGVSQTWWDDGSGWYCDGYGYTWQPEPVQSAEMSVSHDNRSDVQKVGSVGSMVISPLLHVYESTCETVGSFVFEHEHELAVDSRGCESTGGCNGAELEFADMEYELAVDCKDSEFGEADMSCVLAKSCDSCTHEPWFCGLKSGHEVGLGDSSSLGACFDDALSRDLCASVPRKVVLVRAHDWFDDHTEVSVEQQVEPYLEFLRPLLSQVADNTDASWWLRLLSCVAHYASCCPQERLRMAEVIADTCNLSEDDGSPQHGLGEDEKHLQLAETDKAFRAIMTLLEYDRFEEVTKLIGQLGGALREVKPESSKSDESMAEETPAEKAQRYMGCGQSEVSDPDFCADVHYGPRSHREETEPDDGTGLQEF